MANVKRLYGEATRSAKERSVARAGALVDASHPDAQEERRISEIFRRRAREDFSTLGQVRKAPRP